LERALAHGEKHFEPGLLARAHRGFLYIDEVNLLEDHLVDLLLDVAASGENVVEREGVSVRHPAKFVLVGSGNPEEGELRPQLLDRFGLSVEVGTPTDLPTRIDVVRRRDAFERDPAGFRRQWQGEEDKLRDQLQSARRHLETVEVGDDALGRAAELCMALGTDGLRGELTLMRAARAVAALDGDSGVNDDHLKRVAPSALRHRLRRDPLDESGSTTRVERAISEVLGS
jgi:magnesium chelatase subunit I